MTSPSSAPIIDPDAPLPWEPGYDGGPIADEREDGPVSPVVPERESDEEAVLAAWYSGFAYAEHYRKVVLAECREAVRAQRTLSKEKVTEARLDDLARLHPLYLDYLARHLDGRTKWERAVRAAGGMT